MASQARAAYRAMNGTLALASVPGSGTRAERDRWQPEPGKSRTHLLASKRALANDVTVCGEHEPIAYVTEYFLGDGVTTQFNLAADPYFPPSSKSTIIRELFNESQIDLRVWGNPTGQTYLSLGADGLAMQGGNGIDGDTLLTWIDPIEMGGTLLLEATGVTLSPGSTGILAGFFVGHDDSACMHGWISGHVAAGDRRGQCAANRSRHAERDDLCDQSRQPVHSPRSCALPVRSSEPWRFIDPMAIAGAITSGGQWIVAPAKLQFEIQEFVNGVAGMPVTLYDGAIASLPGACMVVAASSVNLHGTMRDAEFDQSWLRVGCEYPSKWKRNHTACRHAPLKRPNAIWKAPASSCFIPGSHRPVGEQIAVSYRTVGRAVGRAVNATSQQRSHKQVSLPSPRG